MKQGPAIFLVLSVCSLVSSYTILHEWTTLDYDWQAIGTPRQDWLNNGSFIPENCALAGIKQWRNDIYVTVPRWTPGVPATLNKVVVKNGQPLLQPFPTISFQDINFPSTLKYVQSMEIDPKGRMWILDAGFVNLFVESMFKWNTPKLVIIDIDSKKVLQTYNFPPEVAIPPSSFLNDIVVDVKNDFAYISDARSQGGLIVYDLQNNVARRWDDASMAAEDIPSANICGAEYDLGPTGSDGIALTPDVSTLYYCPLVGKTLYSIPTALFRDFSTTADQLHNSIVVHGDKTSFSDGLSFDNTGTLYYADIEGCAVQTWDPTQSSSTLTASNQPILISSDRDVQWADTFGWDEKGNLLIVTNRLNKFVNGVTDYTGFSGANYRIISVSVGALSYMMAQSPVS